MAEQPNISSEQRANLAKLAAYLRTLPADYPDFAMSDYTNATNNFRAHVAPCGTAACAVGHGPAAGIPPQSGEDWTDYGSRAFADPIAEWQWLFDGEWSDVDNTAHGAAARIEWLLTRGLPGDAEAQLHGEAPLCYTTTPEANS